MMEVCPFTLFDPIIDIFLPLKGAKKANYDQFPCAVHIVSDEVE